MVAGDSNFPIGSPLNKQLRQTFHGESYESPDVSVQHSTSVGLMTFTSYIW